MNNNFPQRQNGRQNNFPPQGQNNSQRQQPFVSGLYSNRFQMLFLIKNLSNLIIYFYLRRQQYCKP